VKTAEEDFLERLRRINFYRNGNQRAPHKPLYLLYNIATLQKGLPRLQLFEDIQPTLNEALCRFGLANKNQNPHYPFWRLQNDNLAEVSPPSGYGLRQSSNDPKKSSLLKLNARGGLLKKDHALLVNNAALQTQSIHELLDAHFPISIHEDILSFFNLRLQNARSRDVSTDNEFRDNVLTAYQNRCAITGFSIHFRGSFPGLEAAHICWPQSGGNDQITNGISMTTLHRKLFHLGIIGIDPISYSIQIAKQTSELNSSQLSLERLKGKRLELPLDPALSPDKDALSWHMKWVFRD
jgi:putative restriction endonuclease